MENLSDFFFEIFSYGKYTRGKKISIFLLICFEKTWWNNILPILRDLKIMAGVQYTALTTWHDFRLIGNNLWNSYFRKKTDFFFHIFLSKIYHKNQYITLFFFLTWQNNILPIFRDLKVMSGFQYTTLITWYDFGMPPEWQ